MRNKIALDARWIRSKKIDGIGRVCFEYLKRVINKENDYLILYYGNETLTMLKETLRNNKNVTFVKTPFDILSIKDFLSLPAFLRKQSISFYLTFNYLTSFLHKGYKTGVFIHDFIPFIFKDEFSGASYKWKIFFKQKRLIKKILDNADIIFSVSGSTKKDAVKIFNQPENKITVIYNDSTINKEIKPKKIDKLKNKNFFLYVGRKDKYKNVEFLINFFCNANFDYYLVIAGPEDKNFYQAIKEKYSPKDNFRKIIFLDNITENELLFLYKNAFCLIHPSLYEGFGLTVLEAMKFGLPVIALNNPATKEILGDSGSLVEFDNDKALIEAINSLILDNDLYQKISEQETKRAKNFSWDKSADILINKIKESNK